MQRWGLGGRIDQQQLPPLQKPRPGRRRTCAVHADRFVADLGQNKSAAEELPGVPATQGSVPGRAGESNSRLAGCTRRGAIRTCRAVQPLQLGHVLLLPAGNV